MKGTHKFQRATVFAVGLIFLYAFTGCGNAEKKEAPAGKPNVLILFSDQHNKKVMGFEGHPNVITPHLDKLAGEALVFNRAYCTTGICAPSRASFLTGINSRTMGLLTNSERTSVMKEVVSMSTVFQNKGYKTYAFGKRHTHDARDEGWDVIESHLCGESEENYITWLEEDGYIAEFARNRDYREFGDVFFDRINDPGETNNGLNNPAYADEIATLRAYFEDFKAKTPDLGKLEMNGKIWKHKVD